MSLRLRRLFGAGLLCYCAGLAMFSLLPLRTTIIPELVVGILAVIAGIGVVAHMSDAFNLPGEDYAYLVVGFVGVLTMFGYVIGATNEPLYLRLSVAMLLLSGALVGYAGHLAGTERRRES
jgi:hypothetical protein